MREENMKDQEAKDATMQETAERSMDRVQDDPKKVAENEHMTEDMKKGHRGTYP